MTAFRLGLTGGHRHGQIHHGGDVRRRGRAGLGCRCHVHRLYAPGGAAALALAAPCPRPSPPMAPSTARLRRLIAADPSVLDRLNAIVHPLVAADRAAFLAAAQADIVLLDIPLLYETGAQAMCDATPWSAPRPRCKGPASGPWHMTEAMLETILARQMPDAEKRARPITSSPRPPLKWRRGRSRMCWPTFAAGSPPMREIVLDTETTGFEPAEGHRLVEIGAIELFNHLPTGRTWHQYINPDRSMPRERFEVHGIGPDLLEPPEPPKPAR
jgi:dephospho-CoA kinase